MCLIIDAPQGNQIPLELLEDATKRNPDGWGVMYHDGQRLHVHKAPHADAQAIHALTEALPYRTIVHLRMATHGGNTPDNTHPFELIPGRLYMMHNGVVDVEEPHTAKQDATWTKLSRSVRSDTRIFAEDYLKPLIMDDPRNLKNSGLRRFIQSVIGEHSNRLVFMDDTGKVTTFNKRLGIEWKGLWCSNTYAWTLHTPPKPAFKPTKTKGKWDRTDRIAGGYEAWWSAKQDSEYEFEWADRQLQAAPEPIDALEAYESNEDDLLVETQFGYLVPEYVADMFESDAEDMLETVYETPEVAVSALTYLRDNYIGPPR